VPQNRTFMGCLSDGARHSASGVTKRQAPAAIRGGDP